MKELGGKLKELRKAEGYTQKVVAQEIKIAQNTLSQFETGERQPSYGVLCALADFFGCSVDYLLGREDDFGNITLGEKLTDKEKELLASYRELNEGLKTVAHAYIAGLLHK